MALLDLTRHPPPPGSRVGTLSCGCCRRSAKRGLFDKNGEIIGLLCKEHGEQACALVRESRAAEPAPKTDVDERAVMLSAYQRLKAWERGEVDDSEFEASQ